MRLGLSNHAAWRRRARAALALMTLAAAQGAMAEVVYLYSGPGMRSTAPEGGYGAGWGRSGFTGVVSFDDRVLTPGFSGTISQGSFTGSLDGVSFNHGLVGGWPPLGVYGTFYFTFAAGQIVDWYVGGAWGSYIGGGEVISTGRGDSTISYRVMSSPNFSSGGRVGAWTLEGAPSPVPLPLSLPLLALGLAALGATTRRRGPQAPMSASA